MQQIELGNSKQAENEAELPAEAAKYEEKPAESEQDQKGYTGGPKTSVSRANTPLDWVKIIIIMCGTWAYAIGLYAVCMYIMLNIGQQIFMEICAGVYFLFYATYLPTWYRFSHKGEVMAKELVEEKLREMEIEENLHK